MRCPKCDSGMDEVSATFSSAVNRCQNCHGIACPGCGGRMVAIRAAGQKHIRLERCDPCRLTFFDAGKMTDLRYETFVDSVRDLIVKLRGA